MQIKFTMKMFHFAIKKMNYWIDLFDKQMCKAQNRIANIHRCNTFACTIKVTVVTMCIPSTTIRVMTAQETIR